MLNFSDTIGSTRKFLDAASDIKFVVFDHNILAVTFICKCVEAAFANLSYVSINKSAMPFPVSFAKNSGLSLNVFLDLEKNKMIETHCPSMYLRCVAS